VKSRYGEGSEFYFYLNVDRAIELSDDQSAISAIGEKRPNSHLQESISKNNQTFGLVSSNNVEQ
jgi:hypothetical protein